MAKRRPHRGRLASALASVLFTGCVGLAAASCGSGFLDDLVGGRREAGVEDTGSGLVPQTCVGAVPPEAPTVADEDSIEDLSFALETIRVDTTGGLDSGAPVPRGLNLDRTCTCPEAPSCVIADAGTSPLPACDDDAGRDDGLGQFFNLVGVGIPEFREDFGTKRIRDGLFTILIDVFGWNGKPNDPRVTVRVRMSQGFEDREAGVGRPRFDGTDRWTVDPDSILQGTDLIDVDCQTAITFGKTCTPKLADPQAYVRDGALVANLKDPVTGRAAFVLSVEVGRLNIDLTEARLVANIGRVDGKYRLQGELTGRWPVDSILATLANVENPLTKGRSICETADGGGSVYSQVKSQVCASLDLAADPSQDRVPGIGCGAVSSALSFVASPAIAGRVRPRPKTTAACSGWKDDCTK